MGRMLQQVERRAHPEFGPRTSRRQPIPSLHQLWGPPHLEGGMHSHPPRWALQGTWQVRAGSRQNLAPGYLLLRRPCLMRRHRVTRRPPPLSGRRRPMALPRLPQRRLLCALRSGPPNPPSRICNGATS